MAKDWGHQITAKNRSFGSLRPQKAAQSPGWEQKLLLSGSEPAAKCWKPCQRKMQQIKAARKPAMQYCSTLQTGEKWELPWLCPGFGSKEPKLYRGKKRSNHKYLIKRNENIELLSCLTGSRKALPAPRGYSITLNPSAQRIGRNGIKPKYFQKNQKSEVTVIPQHYGTGAM